MTLALETCIALSEQGKRCIPQDGSCADCQAAGAIGDAFPGAKLVGVTPPLCAECGTPQFETPSGVTCANGHGGADSAERATPARQPDVRTSAPRDPDCAWCKGEGPPTDFCACNSHTVHNDPFAPPRSRACCNCKRETLRGLTFHERDICTACAPFAGVVPMIATTDLESAALAAGGDQAGQYLDEIGKTDLATLTGDEWGAFLAKVLEGYSTHMREAAAAAPPF